MSPVCYVPLFGLLPFNPATSSQVAVSSARTVYYYLQPLKDSPMVGWLLEQISPSNLVESFSITQNWLRIFDPPNLLFLV
uniref:Uncharacterized protein n=1 Tax=Oryza barthii TaxID=65489 RepID=A0A0D3ELS8_9ORYZ